MAKSLLEKLRAVDKPAPRKASIPSEQVEAPASNCYDQELGYPRSIFKDFKHVTPETLRLFTDVVLPEKYDPARILYLDTETTGLSHGAGTVAFLVGIGYLTPDGFVVRQLMMRDYPEERFLLSTLQSIMPEYDLLVTFNGRSFDIPLLHSRFLMNRMNPSCLNLPHIDLLHISRRIWKLRLTRCNLARLEEEIFHEPRTDDLPGALVPQRYFDFLRTKDFSLLQDVLRHNAQDIASLCRLLGTVAKLYKAPEQQSFLEDVFSMGVALEKRGETEQARKCYYLATNDTDHLVSGQGRLRLAHSYRKDRDISAAIEMFQQMVNRKEGGVTPYIELAKLYEHKVKDIDAAIHNTRKAILLLAEPRLTTDITVQSMQNALQYRYMRLMRKANSKSAAKSK